MHIHQALLKFSQRIINMGDETLETFNRTDPGLKSMDRLQFVNHQVNRNNKAISSKPQQNGFIESFNGKFRDEYLNETPFNSLADAKVMLEAWRKDYN